MDNQTIAMMSPYIRYGTITYTVMLIVFGSVGNVLLLLTLLYKRYRPISPTPATEMTATTGQPQSVQPIDYANRSVISRARQRQHMSMADELLIVLTTTDLLCLWVVVLRYLIHILTDYDVRTFSIAACKIHTFLTMILSDSSTMILCIFAVHRAVCIHWPLASHTWLTKRRMHVCIIAAFVFILAKHLAVLYLFSLSTTNNGFKCDVREDTKTLNTVYYNFEFATHAVFGYFCLIVANIFLCISLANTQRVQTATQITQNTSPGSGIQIARIILLFSIIQVITSVPFFVVIELSGLYELRFVPSHVELTVYYVLTLAMFTNNAINFYLLLGISERFRQDFLTLCHGMRQLVTRDEHRRGSESYSRKLSEL